MSVLLVKYGVLTGDDNNKTTMSRILYVKARENWKCNNDNAVQSVIY